MEVFILIGVRVLIDMLLNVNKLKASSSELAFGHPLSQCRLAADFYLINPVYTHPQTDDN